MLTACVSIWYKHKSYSNLIIEAFCLWLLNLAISDFITKIQCAKVVISQSGTGFHHQFEFKVTCPAHICDKIFYVSELVLDKPLSNE